MSYNGVFGQAGAGTFNPTTGMQIERLIDGQSSAVTQLPLGLGAVNAIPIEFGASAGLPTDPVQLSAAGALTINQAGTYRIKISLVYGRTTNNGTSELRFRALVNGVQAGQSIGVRLTDVALTIPFTDEAWLTLPAGAVITYQIMRDASGVNDGGLRQPNIDLVAAPDWNPTTCAAIRVERWV